ncbi:MAG: leucine-rich repeat domain-containing protein, partial [Candidatus Cloacimonadaceae bacterium]|nr:leucine-rich repeat domain-containing protein [Candidatus Cloacimonadaceae bacterium]
IIAVYPEFIEQIVEHGSSDQVGIEFINSGTAPLSWSSMINDLNRSVSVRSSSSQAPRVKAEMGFREREQMNSSGLAERSMSSFAAHGNRRGGDLPIPTAFAERYQSSFAARGKQEIATPIGPALAREQDLRTTSRNLGLSLDPDYGYVEPSDTMYCYLNIDSTGSPNGTYYYELVISSNAVNTPEVTIPISITVSGGTPAYIPDDSFRSAINDHLGQPQWYQPSIEDLNEMYGYLDAGWRNISSIEGAHHLTNLQELYLSGNQISDLSPLSSLTNLQELYLSYNQISDLSPLSALTILQVLDLWNNQISDLSPLSALINLYWLNLSYNQISDLSPLNALTNLQVLSLWDNQISDLSPLSSLTNLQELYLGYNQISDLNPLSALTNLQELNLSYNRISDLSPLANLSNLNSLLLHNNPLSYESILLSQSWSLPWSTSSYHPLSPCYPYPPRNDMDVDPASGLSWQANYDYAIADYQVFLGFDSQNLSYIGDGYQVDGTQYAFAAFLEPLTEYYWRIKAVSGSTEIWSGLWSFTTGEEFSGFAGGSGTEADPYQIATAEHLNNVRNYLNAHFLQIADIDLGVSPWNDGEGWSPLGYYFGTYFSGTYDGNGHTVMNLYINRPDSQYIGLFGSVGSPWSPDEAIIEIRNLKLSNVNVIGYANVGGLIGNLDKKSILTNCSVTGNVSGAYWRIGGLVGMLNNLARMQNCCFNGQVAGQNRTGGVIGEMSGHVYNSYSFGSVSGTSFVGGLVGSLWDGYITNCYSNSSVSASENVGGLVGFWNPGYYTAITNSYWNTETTGQNGSAGGEGRTTAEMTHPYAGNTYWNWDFATIWAADLDYGINDGYPYLQWYAPAPDFYPPRFVQAGHDLESIRIMWNSPLTGTPDSYQVWRLLPGQEYDEAPWTLVYDAIADTIVFDTQWQYLPEGTYKWAVKARYVDQLSSVEFSNDMFKEVFEANIEVSPVSILGSPIAGSTFFAECRIDNSGSSPLIWQAELYETFRSTNSLLPSLHISPQRGSQNSQPRPMREVNTEFFPSSGTIQPGEFAVVYLEFYTTESVIPQTFTYNLQISSNATNMPLWTVPITIEVLPSSSENTAPVVSNVRASQRDDASMMIDIYYDVYDADGDALTISMEVSADDGSTWDISCQEIQTGS